jgi:Spy/CpxP family protein refolding chaperone
VTRTIRLTVGAFALSCVSGAWAHDDMMGPGRMRRPAFMRQLFPPALIMQHQSDIGITAAQRQAITKELTDAEKGVVDVRWQLEEKTATLAKLLGNEKVDEVAAMAQADQVLELEARLKRLRLGTLVRVKNLLTAAQQEALRKLQPDEPRDRRGPRRRDSTAPEAPEQ